MFYFTKKNSTEFINLHFSGKKIFTRVTKHWQWTCFMNGGV